MTRKFTALIVSFASTSLLLAGISLAQDKEDSELHKIMEKVQASNGAILKAYRTAVSWKKDQKKASEAAEALVKLGKEAKPLGAEPIKAQKKTQKEWDDLMDSFVKEAEGFVKVAGKDGMTNVEAKKSYRKVSASCTACHEVFRIEE